MSELEKTETVEPTNSASPESKTPIPKKIPPKKVTTSTDKKVKNPKRVAAGKALAAKNKEKYAKIKAFEESEKAKPEASPPVEIETSGQSWTIPVLVGGVIVASGLTVFGYQKLTSASTPTPKMVTSVSATPEKKPNPFEDF